MSVHPRNILLLLVVAALAVANVLMERPRPEAQAQGPLAPGFDTAAVQRVEMSARGSEPLTLLRGDGGWSVAQRRGFPAYAFAVEELLARVRDLRRADRVGEEPAAHDAQGVGDSGARIAFEDGSGRPLLTLVQGAPPGLAAGSNVRLAQEDDVYRAPALPPVALAPAAWLDTRLAIVEPARVRRVAAARAGEAAFELERTEAGWSDAAGGRAPRTRVERLLQVASKLICADVLEAEAGPALGLGDPPQTRLALELEGGERVEVWIGSPTEDNAYHATNRGWAQPWCAALPSATAEVLFAAIEDVARGIQR